MTSWIRVFDRLLPVTPPLAKMRPPVFTTVAFGPRSRVPLTSRSPWSMFRSALALRFASFRTQRLQPLPEPSQVAVADLVTDGVPWPMAPAKNGRLPRRQGDGYRLGRGVDGDGRPRLVPAVGGDVVTGLLARRRHVVARAREGRHAGCAGEGGRVRRVLGLAHLVLGESEVDDDRGQREDHHRERGHDERDRSALVVPATGEPADQVGAGRHGHHEAQSVPAGGASAV